MYLIFVVCLSTFINMCGKTSLLPQKAPIGMRNCGNSCYMNSVIQSLYTLNILNEFIIHSKSANTPNSINAYINLLELINNWSADTYINEEILADYFVVFSDAVNTRSSLFSSGMEVVGSRQQDASEFLLVLFDEMEKSLTPKQQEMFNNILGFTFFSGSNTLHTNIIDISLIANPDLFGNIKSLTEIYAANLNQKILFDSVQEAYNEIAASYLPTGIYIALKLNIFSYINNNPVKIKYPLLIEEELKTINGNFQLIAMTCHQGDRVGGGHYAAYVKRDEGWYFCNDSIIDFLGKYEVIHNHRRLHISRAKTRLEGEVNLRDFDPYVLFYAKKDSRDSHLPIPLPQPKPSETRHLDKGILEEFSRDLTIVELLLL